MASNLLTGTNLVESPFIIVKIGDYEFGSYKANNSSNAEFAKISERIYPNFIDSLSVTKVNGTVNTYTLNMVYQIGYNSDANGNIVGNDPNFLDKVFSKVGYGGKITLKYGDWMLPQQIYKEEEAIITNVTSRMDFSSAKISYTVSGTSNSLKLASDYSDYPYYASKKPSDLIIDLLKTSESKLGGIFPGMYSDRMFTKYIATDDKAVEIQAKTNQSLLGYLNYLVSCMICQTNETDDALQDSVYYLTFHDDSYNQNGGAYFTVIKVNSSIKSLATSDTYEVDINYPGGRFLKQTTENKNTSTQGTY